MPVVKPEHLVPVQDLVGLVNNRILRHHLVQQLGLREVDYLARNRPAMLRHLVVPRRQGLASVVLVQELDFSELLQSQPRAFSAPRRLHQHNPTAASLVLLKQDSVARIPLILALELLQVVDSLVSRNQVYLVTLVTQAVLVQAALPPLVSLVAVNKIPLLLESLHSNSNSKHQLLIPSVALAIIKPSNRLAIMPHSVALGPPSKSNPNLAYSALLLRLVLMEVYLVLTTNKTINSSQQHPACSVAIRTIKLALVRCLAISLQLQAHRSLVPTLRILVTHLEGVYSVLHLTVTAAKTNRLRVQGYSAP